MSVPNLPFRPFGPDLQQSSSAYAAQMRQLQFELARAQRIYADQIAYRKQSENMAEGQLQSTYLDYQNAGRRPTPYMSARQALNF